ncbi:unnamed protein product [Rangifer tarandus platyrhynchus]|uniref:Uncharacterized protein n=1 Tax=Rangifer tarandus platyrhynchus TaxID=3082113 RepID=A0AC59ZVF1_RANTA
MYSSYSSLNGGLLCNYNTKTRKLILVTIYGTFSDFTSFHMHSFVCVCVALYCFITCRSVEPPQLSITELKKNNCSVISLVPHVTYPFIFMSGPLPYPILLFLSSGNH